MVIQLSFALELAARRYVMSRKLRMNSLTPGGIGPVRRNGWRARATFHLYRESHKLAMARCEGRVEVVVSVPGQLPDLVVIAV